MRKINTSFLFYIFAYAYDPQLKSRAGGLIRIFDLADNLIRAGHSVILFLPRIGAPKRQTIAEVVEIPFIDLPILRPLSFHLISSIALLFNLRKKPALFYVRQMNSFAPMAIAKLLRTPSFFEIPNDPYLAYQGKSKIRLSLERIIDKYSMILSDRVVVLSEWSKLRLNRFGGISLSKVIVLPSGTDTRVFKPLPKKECCTKLGLDPSLLYVGFVGTFFFHQGIDTLIESAPNILKEFPNARFLLVGDGPMMSSWQEKVNRRGLAWAFFFPGHVSYRKVPEYIGAMDICVAPHRRDTNQASPVKIFDYMACGKPIVVSDIEVTREIVGNSRFALLVSPERPDHLSQAIIDLIKEQDKANAMSLEARRRAVDSFDRRKILEDLIHAVKELYLK
jgi:glycosyltransferase involved in cell wall biosynthesis